MLKTSGYCAFENINLNAGTKVFYHEIQALKQVTDLKFVTAREYPGTDIPFKKFELERWYPFNPFLADYFTSQLIPLDCYGVDLLHLACSPGLAILNLVRPKKYVVHIVAHDLKASIEEHERYFGAGSYPYPHNTDQYLHELLLKHAENADVIVTASNPAKKWIENNIKCKRVEAIPHGTDIPNEIKLIPDKFTVGYMGAFGPDKGLPYLLMAWRYFNFPDSELIFAGTCCQAFQQENIRNAFATGIERFKLLGWVDNIADFYNNISVYCQPSVTEGFGIEIVEAMVYGRPVIVTSTTGSVDLVTDGVDGFIVPPRDPKAILDKINYFKDNPNKIVEMGNMAREKAKKYSWDFAEKCYVKLYEEILSK